MSFADWRVRRKADRSWETKAERKEDHKERRKFGTIWQWDFVDNFWDWVFQRKVERFYDTKVETAEERRVRNVRAQEDRLERKHAPLHTHINFHPLRRPYNHIPFDTALGAEFRQRGFLTVVWGDIEEGYEISLLVWGHVAIVLLFLGYIGWRGWL